MRLAELSARVLQRFWLIPEYPDGDGRHTQTVLTATTHFVKEVTTVLQAAELLKELVQLEPQLDWDDICLTGREGVMDSLQDLIAQALISVLLMDKKVAAEESRRQAISQQ